MSGCSAQRGWAGQAAVLATVAGMLIYLVVAIVLGFQLLPRLAYWINRLPISQGVIAFVLVTCLIYAWAAEQLGGMAAITGAFMVGLFLARTPFGEQMEQGISVMAYGFVVSIFFVNIGLEVNMRSIGTDLLWFALVFTVVAILSKIIGSGGGASLGGMTPKESLQLGIGMVSRGEVGLIVAAFALSQGVLSKGQFSVAIFMVVVATLITPPMRRAAFAREPQEPETRKAPASEVGEG